MGVDTDSWQAALKNTLRQAPDVILIGEIRDRETMEYGIQFSETGHLVLATLHANSANQALDRIINFFPDERREQLLMDLSLNIRALISQRLIPRESGAGRIAAMEIMLNSPLIQDLIFKGEVAKIKEVMSRSTRLGMKTFDQALFELYETGYHLLRGCAAQRRLEERAAAAHQAREQARAEERRRRRRAEDRRGRAGPQPVKAAKDAPAREDLEVTGPNPAITEVVNAVAAGRHPTLNTKPLFKLMVETQGVGPVLHLQRAHQDQDRRPDPAGEQAGADPGDGAPDGVRADDAGAARALRQSEWELDFAVSEPGLGRFRVNVFMQRGYPAMVLRYITADMPRLDSLGLPEIMSELTLLKRGLVLMVGATGSGKSTTLAAMINYRNENASDHIVTIEDPIEFLHTNKRSIVNQREVGLDTKTYARALRGVVRAAPDVILIGEIRDREAWRRPSTSPAPATWCSRRCTPTTARSRSTASSTCSRASSTTRSSSTCRSTCAPSWRSAW